MAARERKMDIIAGLTQKQIDQIFKKITHFEKAILLKKQQISALENYKNDYNQKKLEPGLKLPLMIKNIYDFLTMIQKTIENLNNEIDILVREKNQNLELLKKLNVKKDIIEKYIGKIQFEERAKLDKAEQKITDELAVQFFHLQDSGQH